MTTEDYKEANDAYFLLTRIYSFDFEKLDTWLNQTKDPERTNYALREKCYARVMWHIPGGRYLEVDPYAEAEALVVHTLSIITNVNIVAKTDIDRDADIDNIDDLIFGRLQDLPCKLHYTCLGITPKESIPSDIEFKNGLVLTKTELPTLHSDGQTNIGWINQHTHQLAKIGDEIAGEGHEPYEEDTTLQAGWSANDGIAPDGESGNSYSKIDAQIVKD